MLPGPVRADVNGKIAGGTVKGEAGPGAFGGLVNCAGRIVSKTKLVVRRYKREGGGGRRRRRRGRSSLSRRSGNPWGNGGGSRGRGDRGRRLRKGLRGGGGQIFIGQKGLGWFKIY